MLSMTATTVMTTTMALLLLVLVYFSIYCYNENIFHDEKRSWPYFIFLTVPIAVSYSWYFMNYNNSLRTTFQCECVS